MSGHEKFYIPHDDLLELKTAIESLETAIETLDTNIQTLNERLLDATTEDRIIGDDTSVSTTEILDLYDAVLDADDACYLKRMYFTVRAGSEFFRLRKEEVVISVANATTTLWLEPVCGGIYQPYVFTTDPDVWQLQRTIILNNLKVPAGDNLNVDGLTFNMPVGTFIQTQVWYVKEIEI